MDRRRQRLPRNYLSDPDAFGQPRPVGPAMPPGGDQTSARIAWTQHELVAAWRRRGCKPSGAALGRRFGFSKSTFSRVALGHRWAGEAVLTALLTTADGDTTSARPGR